MGTIARTLEEFNKAQIEAALPRWRKAKALHDAGTSADAIAALMGVSRSAVWHMIHRAEDYERKQQQRG